MINARADANVGSTCIVIEDFRWTLRSTCIAQLNCNPGGCVGDSLRRTSVPGECQNTSVEGRASCRLVSLENHVEESPWQARACRTAFENITLTCREYRPSSTSTKAPDRQYPKRLLFSLKFQRYNNTSTR